MSVWTTLLPLAAVVPSWTVTAWADGSARTSFQGGPTPASKPGFMSMFGPGGTLGAVDTDGTGVGGGSVGIGVRLGATVGLGLGAGVGVGPGVGSGDVPGDGPVRSSVRAAVSGGSCLSRRSTDWAPRK